MSNNVLSVADVQQAERLWADRNGGSTWPLMVAASKSFVSRFRTEFRRQKMVVFAGNGNNGGDGFYIARLLLDLDMDVSVAAPFGMPPESIDAWRACQAYLEKNGSVTESYKDVSADLFIDALFGIGLNRPLTGSALDVIQWLNAQNKPVYSVDVPSGLNAQTGVPMPVAIQAQATHSFIAFKPGILTHSGPSHCGELRLDTLGVETRSNWSCRQEFESLLPARRSATHKAEHGRVRVVGGLETMTGAAIISAQAALTAGAGRVHLHCDDKGFSAVVARTPEIMTSSVHSLLNDQPDGFYILGPGLGQSSLARQLWQALVPVVGGVLDADGLRMLASQPMPVPDWILTPHEGEAAALLGCSSDTVKFDRPAAAQAVASKYSTTVVLKGAGTIIATPETRVFCHPGSPAMATPGMGDCLAGMIGSLRAQGLCPLDASVAGVNWHATTGGKLAAHQRIVLASDIISKLTIHPELLHSNNG